MAAASPASVRVAVFDVGETLVDETRAWSAHADAVGVTRLTLFAALGALIERGEDHRQVWGLLGVEPPAKPAEIRRDDLYPDAIPCLRALVDAGMRIGLAGNQPAAAHDTLEQLALPVSFIASSGRWGVEKPSPEFFARLVEAAAAPADQIAYVGDRLDNDVLPASRAGMFAVFIRRGPWGHLHGHRPELASASATIESLRELPALLAGGTAPRRGSRTDLRARVQTLLRFSAAPQAPRVDVLDERERDGYSERLVEYRSSEGEPIRAFLLQPHGQAPTPAVVVHHQHNGERHLGKSEVVGLAGDPIQALAPRLARRGVAVLAPDAICFEDRRRNASGTEPHADDERQHYDETASRLVRGELLMSAIVADAALAWSVLADQSGIDPERVGMLGHSMGGHTTLFAAAVDERVRFACISGALCGYRARMGAGVGIELAQLIPGVTDVTDFDGLLGLIAPRPTCIVSAQCDPYSFDAPSIVARARPAYEREGAGALLRHAHDAGEHPLTERRVETIIDWTTSAAAAS